MGTFVTLSLELEIIDAKEFRDNAIARYTANAPNATPEELEDFFGSAEEPNCGGCARELFDFCVDGAPAGCEIQDSSAEEYEL